MPNTPFIETPDSNRAPSIRYITTYAPCPTAIAQGFAPSGQWAPTLNRPMVTLPIANLHLIRQWLRTRRGKDSRDDNR